MLKWLYELISRPEPTPGPEILYFDAFHNTERMRTNAQPLTRNKLLDIAASEYAAWMARWNKLTHNSISLKSRVRRSGYIASQIGENIAIGKTELEVFGMWCKSPNHYANIISTKYTEYGYASSVNKNGTRYWCVIFGSPKT